MERRLGLSLALAVLFGPVLWPWYAAMAFTVLAASISREPVRPASCGTVAVALFRVPHQRRHAPRSGSVPGVARHRAASRAHRRSHRSAKALPETPSRPIRVAGHSRPSSAAGARGRRTRARVTLSATGGRRHEARGQGRDRHRSRSRYRVRVCRKVRARRCQVIIAEPSRGSRQRRGRPLLGSLGEVHVVATDVASEESTESAARASPNGSAHASRPTTRRSTGRSWNRLIRPSILPTLMDESLRRLADEQSGRALHGRPRRRPHHQPSSGAGLQLHAGRSPTRSPGLNSYNYSMSKWGVVGLTKYMRRSSVTWEHHGSTASRRVSSTPRHPGRSSIRSMLAMLAQRQAVRGQLGPETPHRCQRCFFATDEAAFINRASVGRRRRKHMPA